MSLRRIISKLTKSNLPGDNQFNANGWWVLEDRNHQWLAIRKTVDGAYWVDAWAENRDDLWSWTSPITDAEFAVIAEDPSCARDLLSDSRVWHVKPPADAHDGLPYVKEGKLGWEDGFRDRGTGGIW